MRIPKRLFNFFAICLRQMHSKLSISFVFLLILISLSEAHEETHDPLNALTVEYCPLNFKETNKTCNIRDSYVQRSIWNHWSGGLCYKYTNTYRLKFKYKVVFANFHCNGERFQIPLTLITNGTDLTSYFWYDYTNTTSNEYVRASFRNSDYYALWIECCKEAVDCCDNFMNDDNIRPSDEYPCPAVWDAWSCFAPAKLNTMERLPCPGQAYSTNAKVCQLTSEKECFVNGTWNPDTNYHVCAIAPILRRRHLFHVYFLCVASVLALPAVLIFSGFRTLRKNVRLRLHRNLIAAILLRNVLTILTKELIILDALQPSGSRRVMERNGAPCRALAFLENAAKNAIYACMLVDGLYLHKLIVRVFAKDPNPALLRWAVVLLAFIPSLAWAALRIVHRGEDCWMVDDSGDQWVSDGIRMVILAINLLLLVDIIRVMIVKLRLGSASQQTIATFRATVFLIPLFGVHIIVIANRNIVQSPGCSAEDVYYYVSYSLEAAQGIVVALLFCYCSSEVHGEIRNAYRKCLIRLEQRLDGGQSGSAQRRRTTAATFVGPNSANENDENLHFSQFNNVQCLPNTICK